MTVRRPTLDQLRVVARELNLDLAPDELASFHALLMPGFVAYDVLDAIPDHVPAVRYPRTPGYRPEGEEDRLNAWYVKSEVKGAATGPLTGRTVALKDNICLAGVPMMNGASVLEGYIPDVDATVVIRILDAGGTIAGKTNCEYFCFSAGSHTNATGPTYNPHKPGHSAGGSSSGSAAVVAAGEVDMALGCDQGGSIRVPASFCGICGLKPTHGLVPYSGITPMEVTLDHVGPMTCTVADNALLLSVLAGPDGLDSRQGAPVAGDYMAALARGVEGVRIGIVKEGFGHANSEADVDAMVLAAAAGFAKLGATVEDVSVPMHPMGRAIWRAIAAEGGTEAMLKGNAFGRGLYVTSLRDAQAAWWHRADELPDSLKVSMLLGQYMTKHYRGHYYGKAQNLSRRLRAAYDQALSRCDLLLMPTASMKAPPIPPRSASRELLVQRSGEPLANTASFNCSGHPAMTVPCGMSKGLPVGMMLIGKHYDETTIYQAAAAFEAGFPKGTA